MRNLPVLLLAVLVANGGMAASTSEALPPTHRQADILKPAHGSISLTLHSFVLDRAGNIIAAVSPHAVPSRELNSSKDGPRGWLQVYSPERKLLREIPLTFTPTALALTPEGHFLAAGEGELCKCTTDGKMIVQTKVIKLLDIDEDKLREEVIADYKRDQAQYASSREAQLKTIRDQIARLETKPESERTARDKSRILSLQAMLRSMSANEGEIPAARLTQLMQYRLRIPSIASTPDGVVVTIYRNRGYEVWRTGAQFEQPRRVIGDLRGCCGQMDVITFGDRIMTAENTKFRVGIYDLEGKNLSAFGEKFKEGNNGFGGCCNPMNVLCCANGDIVTAESSIGHIKRFSPDGKLVALVGRARIGGGCKHVALGFDEARDRYYVQYQDLNHICVMLPEKEAAPLVADQDKKLKQAEDAALKLVGKWVVAPSKTPTKAPEQDALNELYGYVQDPRFDSFTFNADHSVSLAFAPGGSNPGDNGFRRWYAAGSEGGAIHFEMEVDDGYVDFVMDVTVRGNDLIDIKVGRETRTYQRKN